MILAFVLLTICFELNNRKSNQYQESVIHAIIVWNLCSFVIVELLSGLYMLTGQGVAFLWGITDISLAFYAGMYWFRNKKINTGFGKGILQTGKFLWNHKLIAVAGIAVLLLAAVTIPYTPDSLTYHIPRIAHWAQNRSVAHFATNDVRQLSSPVLAEFINVQVYLLTGKRDNWLNLLQAFSYLINGWMVYRIAVKIGCKEKFAALATLLFMTMPIAFGEALTTQVDLFAAVWLLIFIYYYIDVYETEKLTADKRTLNACMGMGVCISFGYLAKPSVNIGMAVLLLLLLIRCIKRGDRIAEIGKLLICVLPMVILPLLPELVRNHHTFAALSDPSTGKRQLVGTMRPHYLLVNLLKNFAQNWPNIYLHDSEEWIAKIVMIVAGILRVDINDASIAEDGIAYIMPTPPVYNNDTASNPVVMILASVGFLFCLTRIRRHKNIGNRYSLWAMTLFIVFCGAVRWEPFVTRYMLAYLALLCPVIGWQGQTFAETFKKEELRGALLAVVYFICITELFSLCRYHQELWHEDASVRPEHFFLRDKDRRTEYMEVLDWVKENELKKIGLKCGRSGFEYVIWYMLKEPELWVEHVLVDNESKVYMDNNYIPDCIIGSVHIADEENQVTVNGISYQESEQFEGNEYITVYLR